MARGIIDNTSVDFSCPDCGQKIKKAVGWLYSHPEITYPGCGKTITLETKGLKRGAEQVDKAISDFARHIGKLNKRK